MAVIAAAVWFLAHNTLENMRVRGIQSGFGFLTQPAGFDIGESAFAFDSADPYWKAFLVGLSNTLRAALVGIVLTTILGTLIGIGRLSRNFLVRSLCTGYVELFRNIPVLMQLLMWYFVLNEWLPPVADALHPLPGIFLSKSGMSFPVPEWEQGHLVTLAGLVARASSPPGSTAAGRAPPSSGPAWRGRWSGPRWSSLASARCWAGSPAARRRRWSCRCATTSTSPAAAP